MLKSYFITGLVAVILIIAAIIGCSGDIVLEPLPSLLGYYDGRYSIKLNYGQSYQTTEQFQIEWKFTDYGYWMYVLEDSAGVCAPSGNYALTDGVTLEELEPGCSGTIGIEAFNPRGYFSLMQPGDSVILTQQIVDTVREIRLVKRPQ